MRPTQQPARGRWFGILAVLATALAARPSAAFAADDPAAQLLQAGRQAYQECNYPQAADRFREFLQKYPQSAEVPAARLALGRILVEGPQKNYDAAKEVLMPLTDDKEYAERGQAFYLLGLSERGLGVHLFAQAKATPNEAKQILPKALEHFNDAAMLFANASNAFTDRAERVEADEKAPFSPDWEWALRAKCDQAEMLLRAEKFEKAASVLEKLLAIPIMKSRYWHLVLYQHGQAAFALDDYPTAFRDLGQLAPYKDTGFGLHARYLLARMHEQTDERPEATLHYEAVLTGYEAEKKGAQESLRDGNKFRDNPDERLRLEALVRDPPPEFVRRTEFHLGGLAFANGRFPEAAARFQTYLKTNPPAEVLPDVELRLGMALVQSKQFAEALKILQPLAKRPNYLEAALTWSARAHAAGADPKNAATYQQELRAAADDFVRAVSANGAEKDPDVAARRIELTLELADVRQALKQPAEAVALYQQLLQDKTAPRGEELLSRLAVALQLAGKYDDSEAACRQFEKNYPSSAGMAEIEFRSAENAFQLATRAADKSSPTSPAAKQLYETSIQRNAKLIEKFPESPNVNLARLAIATANYQLGRFTEAAESLSTLAEADRVGDLAGSTYLQADCLLRTLPTDTSDAISAGRRLAQLNEAIQLLTKFTAAPPNTPNMPEAILKLIDAQAEYAGLLADPKERNDLLNLARQNCEKFKQQFNDHPLKPQVYMERARCMALAGDLGGAVNDLNRFQGDPYRHSPVAPLALLRMSAYMRQQNRAADALKIIEECRKNHEEKLLADPARKDWVPQLQFQHATLLQDTGKFPEARALFEAVTQKFANTLPGVDAIWHAAQCRREEAAGQLDAARKIIAKGNNAKPEEIAAARETKGKIIAGLNDAAKSCELAAVNLSQTPFGFEPSLRLLYEAAWCHRAAFDPQPPPTDGETQAVRAYQKLIETGLDSQLAIDAQLELAEMLGAREQHDEALKLVNEALDKDPTPEMVDKLLLMAGQCLLCKQDYTAALEKFEGVAKNDKNPLSPEARYRVAEVFYQQKNWQKVVERLTPFRDRGELQNISGTSERALFRLGQSLIQLQQWEPARQTLENFVNRFAESPNRDEARRLIEVAKQNKK